MRTAVTVIACLSLCVGTGANLFADLIKTFSHLDGQLENSNSGDVSGEQQTGTENHDAEKAVQMALHKLLEKFATHLFHPKDTKEQKRQIGDKLQEFQDEEEEMNAFFRLQMSNLQNIFQTSISELKGIATEMIYHGEAANVAIEVEKIVERFNTDVDHISDDTIDGIMGRFESLSAKVSSSKRSLSDIFHDVEFYLRNILSKESKALKQVINDLGRKITAFSGDMTKAANERSEYVENDLKDLLPGLEAERNRSVDSGSGSS